MSKYDFDIDLSTNTSTGLILSKVKAGSVVLEFGCATGRMTRYMKEALGCKVYIVEYDESAYRIALDYAEDGLCDDILNLKWVEKFKNIQFDVIIFADVLEHLINPKGAVDNAKNLLKDLGEMYISIPNITHNDILLKAYDDHFDYTKIGILDDTHVHFWGLKNIEQFAEDCGLHIGNIEATYCAMGMTEQFAGTSIINQLMIINKLNERKCGEVYQFVITLDKQESNRTCISLKRPAIKSHIYLDYGEGFNENEIIEFDSESYKYDRYIAHYVIEDTSELKQIRFDPVELQGCILQNISIYQDGRELPFTCSDHIIIEDGILLLGNDPMLTADVLSQERPIVINADIIILGNKYVEMLCKTCVNQYLEIERCELEFTAEKQNLQGKFEGIAVEKQNLQEKIQEILAENDKLLATINDLTVENKNLQEEAKCISTTNERLQKEIQKITLESQGLQAEVKNTLAEKEQLQVDLGAYIILANNKDKLLIEKEKFICDTECLLKEKDNLINEQSRVINEQDAVIKNQETHILNVEGELYYYKHLPVMRFRFFLIRIWRGLKKYLGKLIKRRKADE